MTTIEDMAQIEEYLVLIQQLSSDEGGGWMATLPDLPGWMDDGETEAEAIADVRSAARDWLDQALELGRDIPKPSLHHTLIDEAELP
ncbi:MAG: type II toxin-antitoxin system HicB family antitoxin [Ahrensia sp.]|nr:type II toxin-antitoxin system HicB family antitoxin [Ahrensia sp.]